jgi:hypothetical protein
LRRTHAITAAVAFALAVPGAASGAPPANDNYQTPATLVLDEPLTGTTVEATTQDALPEPLTPASGLACPQAPEPPAQMTNTVWYLVTPPNGPNDPPSPRITVNTIGSTTDTVLAVYNTDGTGAPANPPPNASDPGTNMFGCNDDAGPFTNRSRVAFTAQAGFGYLIQVGTINGDPPGAIRVLASHVPGNDLRANATTVAGGTLLLRPNTGAAEETGEDLECDGVSLGSTIWFRFEAPSAGRVTFDSVGGLDTVMQLYAGDGTAPIACNDDAPGATGPSRVSVDVEPGTYFVQVGAFAGAQGDITFGVHFSPEDRDGDGIPRPTDCDDNDVNRRPGVSDVPDNGVDEDCSGADAVNLDRDGDGAARPEDCDDGDAAIRPGAVDRPGDGVDQDCSGADTEFALLAWTFSHSIRANGTVRRLRVRVREGARVRMTCRGGGCPKGKSMLSDGKRLKLQGLFDERLAPGARITLRATLADHIGRFARITRRRGKPPRVVQKCLVPGSNTPVACP